MSGGLEVTAASMCTHTEMSPQTLVVIKQLFSEPLSNHETASFESQLHFPGEDSIFHSVVVTLN